MHIVLAGLGAWVVGTGDFLGGTAARRSSPFAVALFGTAVGALVTLLAAFVTAGRPDGSDLAWGAVSGLGGALGVATLYRGFGRAPMGLVSPIAGVVGTALPVVGGLLLGDRIGPVVAAGLAVGVVGIVLVSGPSRATDAGSNLSAVGHGLVTGVGFGVLLLALALVDEGAGLAPLAAGRLAAATALTSVGALSGRRLLPERPGLPVATAAGVLTALGGLLYYLALSRGPVVESAPVYALFPAATVVMARLVHGERLRRIQVIGVVASLAAGALLAVGSLRT